MDTEGRIDAVCREWAEDSGEPFVTLIAHYDHHSRGFLFLKCCLNRGRNSSNSMQPNRERPSARD